MSPVSTTAGTDTDHVARMFDAITRGDMAAVRACFAPGARIWHNDDEVECDIDQTCAVLGFLCDSSKSVAYEDQRIVRTGNLRFIQHVLTAELLSGQTLRLPAMMRVEVSDDGLVTRIEEYYDSRATDCLK